MKPDNNSNSEPQKSSTDDIQFKPIGVIRTVFAEKRAVPRQPSVGSKLQGRIDISASVFNNPEHSLEGLTGFSHMWVIYHFHKNDSHAKAKVAPPRLSGERVGVFSTRSPHRPCPIGLSLVEIERVEGNAIYFLGTDMVDGTPVLDIKPYIPHYDNPLAEVNRRTVAVESIGDGMGAREEPDGEEMEMGAAALMPTNDDAKPTVVKVPNWVAAKPVLTVVFNERAEAQAHDMNIDKKVIVDVLEADPRSVYLRTKYGSQIFTFQIGETTVICKFDDKNATVTVLQVRKTEQLQDN